MRIMSDPRPPRVVESDGPELHEWVNLESIKSKGGGGARVLRDMSCGDVTTYLMASDFELDIPPNVTVIGVVFTVRSRSLTGSATIARASLLTKYDTLISIAHGAVPILGAYSDASFYVGPEFINSFGLPIAPNYDEVREIVSSREFGIAIRVSCESKKAEPEIDSIEARVVYDAPDDVETRLDELEKFVTALEARTTLLEERSPRIPGLI